MNEVEQKAPHLSPLLTLEIYEAMLAARSAGRAQLECSLDLQRSRATVDLDADGWRWGAARFPYPEKCRDRTIYYFTAGAFEPVARYGQSLIKLVPTQWGPPTFEIDGVKMLPTARLSPYEDAANKVALIQPRGKVILDTCGGLGYFAAWCLEQQASRVISFEKNADVIWLRQLNPWSPVAGGALELQHADVVEQIRSIADASIDAALHDPPRFGLAGELYSQAFYDELARVLKRKGRLFHYTGEPNKLTSGRDVPREVAARLQRAGFTARLHGDGVLAQRS